jgi:hypothetical protein
MHKMRTHPFFHNSYMVTALLIAMAMGTLVLTMPSSMWRAMLPSGSKAAPKTIGDVQPPNTLADQRSMIERNEADARHAQSDMFLYAVRHGSAVDAVLAFGEVADFDEQWTLFHSELVTADGNTVNVYTAVNRYNPAVRYTAQWDMEAGRATQWERAPVYD